MRKELNSSKHKNEIYISVDIEAAGPVPPEYSMLSLGACVVGSPEESFYVELKPISDLFVPEALAVNGLSLEQLRSLGTDPAHGMETFRQWITEVSTGFIPVFVGFNAPFDWQFINWYCHKFLGANPFGINALDIKAYYMGYEGCAWSETSSSKLPVWLQLSQPKTHNALDDAIAQAEIFHRILSTSRLKS